MMLKMKLEYYTCKTLIKLFFDIDVMLKKKCTKKLIKDTDDMVRCQCKSIIEAKYPNKELIVLTRPIRKVIHEKEGKLKISYRIVVNNAITNVDNLEQVVISFKNDKTAVATYFDSNVYRDGSNECLVV